MVDHVLQSWMDIAVALLVHPISKEIVEIDDEQHHWHHGYSYLGILLRAQRFRLQGKPDDDESKKEGNRTFMKV